MTNSLSTQSKSTLALANKPTSPELIAQQRRQLVIQKTDPLIEIEKMIDKFDKIGRKIHQLYRQEYDDIIHLQKYCFRDSSVYNFIFDEARYHISGERDSLTSPMVYTKYEDTEHTLAKQIITPAVIQEVKEFYNQSRQDTLGPLIECEDKMTNIIGLVKKSGNFAQSQLTYKQCVLWDLRKLFDTTSSSTNIDLHEEQAQSLYSVLASKGFNYYSIRRGIEVSSWYKRDEIVGRVELYQSQSDVFVANLNYVLQLDQS